MYIGYCFAICFLLVSYICILLCACYALKNFKIILDIEEWEIKCKVGMQTRWLHVSCVFSSSKTSWTMCSVEVVHCTVLCFQFSFQWQKIILRLVTVSIIFPLLFHLYTQLVTNIIHSSVLPPLPIVPGSIFWSVSLSIQYDLETLIEFS